jgi:hypothetical protein
MKMNFNLMKSHDCHVLMTALLPVALRGIKTGEKTIGLREEAFCDPMPA